MNKIRNYLSDYFNRQTIRFKFLLSVIGLIVFSYFILGWIQIRTGQEATESHLREMLKSYKAVSRILLQSGEKILGQETSLVTGDRELLRVVKCWASFQREKYKCGGQHLSEDLLAQYPGKTSAEIFKENPDIKKDTEKLLLKKIRENSNTPLNHLKALNPNMSKLSFYFQGREIYRSGSEGNEHVTNRPIVLSTAREKKAFVGIDIDRGEAGFFQTIPIFFPKEYIVGEIGITLKSLLSEMRRVTESDEIGFMAYKDGKRYGHSLSEGIVESDWENVARENEGDHFEIREKAHFFLTLKNYSGETIGKVVLIKNIDDLLNEQRMTIFKLILIVFITIVVLISLLVGLFTILVDRPLHEMGDIIQDIAKGRGDLTRRMTIKSRDEIGEVSSGFNTFVDKIHSLVILISEITEQLSTATEQLSATATRSAQGTEEQTERMTQVAAAIEEMSASIADVARNTNDTSDATKSAVEIATTGGTVVSQAVSKMSLIEERVKDSSETIGQLGKSSEQIGEIIEVIDDIADQTNLLALNAAIEAARAGDAGRGFAVVADEVRKLAERTTKATKEISDKINVIQKDAQVAVTSMETGKNEVSEGVEQINKAGDALHDIMKEVDRVTAKVEEISTAMVEQSTTADEIAKNTEEVSTVASTLEQDAQDSSRATEELTILFDDLKEVVSQFKLR